MLDEIDWGSLSKEGGGSKKTSEGKTRFLKFEANKTHVFRPVGGGIEFYKFYYTSPKGKRNVCVNKKDKNKAAEILSKHFGKEIIPQRRFAINVIDRDDSQIKILEGGYSIFKFFAMWTTKNEEQPVGGIKGGDWMVEVTGENMQRRYSTGFIGQKPLTPEEMKRVKEKKEFYTLKEVYRECPLNKLVEYLTGETSTSDISESEHFNTVETSSTEAALSDDPSKW